MRSTFKVLFYLKRNKDKDQKVVPVMGRITVNGSIAQFSAKLSVPETLWEAGAFVSVSYIPEFSVRESVSVNTQDTEHRAVGLFFGEQTGVVFVVFLVPVDDDVFRDGGVMRTVAGNSYIMIT